MTKTVFKSLRRAIRENARAGEENRLLVSRSERNTRALYSARFIPDDHPGTRAKVENRCASTRPFYEDNVRRVGFSSFTSYAE